MNRRQFVKAAAVACAACQFAGCAQTGGTGPVYLSGPVDVGAMADLDRTSILDSFAKSHGFFVVRLPDRLVAISAVCTHRNCEVQAEQAELVCPCHDSHFNRGGQVVSGPAPRPLPRFAISIQGDRVIVDPSRRFEQPQWDDPAAKVAWAAK